jgi:hypothetical protein
MDWIWSSRCLSLSCTSTQSSNLKWVSGGGINSPRQPKSCWAKKGSVGWTDASFFEASVHPVPLPRYIAVEVLWQNRSDAMHRRCVVSSNAEGHFAKTSLYVASWPSDRPTLSLTQGVGSSVLKTSSWRVSVLIQTERQIDRRCPHLDRQIIRCYYLCCSSSATRLMPRVSPSVPTHPTIAPTLAILVPLVHPTIFFLFLFFLVFDPWKIDYLLNLACGILASLGPRNVYKDMLNKWLVPLIMLSWITKFKLELMAYEATFSTISPFFVIYDNTTKTSINLQKMTKLEPLTLAWMLTIIQTPPRSNFPLFDLLFLCSLIACLFPLWNH